MTCEAGPGIPSVRTPCLQSGMWEEGGTRHVVFVAAGIGSPRAFACSNGPAPGEWRAGSAWLADGPGARDLRATFHLVDPDTATEPDMEALGVLGGPAHLSDMLADQVAGNPRQPVLWMESLTFDLSGKDGDVGAAFCSRTSFGFPGRAGVYGFGAKAGVVIRPLPHVPGDGDMETFLGMSLQAVREAMTARVAEAAAFLAGPGDAESFAVLGRNRWTSAGHAWLALPGAVGDRRRQAAALYPGFVPILSSRPALSAAIDGGRPFERILVRETEPLWSGFGRLVPAGLRRLRGLSANADFGRVRDAARIAASVPVDLIPTDAIDLTGFVSCLGPAVEPSRRLGIDLADLARGAPQGWFAEWFTFFPPMPVTNPNVAVPSPWGAMGQAVDMAERLATTLVAPLMEVSGAEPAPGAALAVAGRILYGGRSFRAVVRLQERWHADLPGIEAALRCGLDNAWPVPFRPFVAPCGLTVTCLADEAALLAEGTRGPDADGLEGLGHCVGGYGERCHSGRVAVASIRSAEGRRLSTVELVPAARGVALRVAQHYGRGNGPPPPEAVKALDGLLSALARGAHPFDRDAFRRPRKPYVRALDMRDPLAIRRVFEAWRPYLPRAVAGGGPAALAERVRAYGGPIGAGPGMEGCAGKG